MSNLFMMYEVLTNGVKENILVVISILSIICGILVIINKNPIVSVLFLIGLFLTIATYLIVLGISFIGLSYLLVYVGAVSILFLFILMLINVRISELTTDNNNSIALSLIIIGIFSLVFHDNSFYSSNKSESLLLSYFQWKHEEGKAGSKIEMDSALYNSKSNLPGFSLKENQDIILESFTTKGNLYHTSHYIWDSALAETSHITSIGNILYTSYPILLLITSIILLLAMIGSIIITLRK